MGVYQSATEPEIKRRILRQVEDRHLIDQIGEANMIAYHRKWHKIPSKTKPVVTTLSDPSAIEFYYSWFEVETFN